MTIKINDRWIIRFDGYCYMPIRTDLKNDSASTYFKSLGNAVDKILQFEMGSMEGEVSLKEYVEIYARERKELMDSLNNL